MITFLCPADKNKKIKNRKAWKSKKKVILLHTVFEKK